MPRRDGCETAQWLNELRLAGKIHKVSATNFDTDRMLHMVDAGVPLTSMQVQYSLLDARPAKRMVEAATANGVALFCYGTVAGGFLGDRWLGQPEPADLREPLADQIQADHRRSRRLGFLPGAAEDAARRSPTGTASTSPPSPVLPCCRRRPSRRHRRRAQPLPSRLEPRHLERRADRRGSGRDRRGAVAGQRARRRRLHAGARPQRPARPDHEIQSEQGSRLRTRRPREHYRLK